MNKKILHIIDQSYYAGVTTYAVRIVKYLPQYNHHIIYCYKGNAFDEICAMNIACENLINWETISYRSLLLKYFKSILYLSKNSFDIIHYHQGGIGILLIAVIFRKKAKVIHHLHSGNLIGDNTKQEISFIHLILLKLLSNRTYQIAVAAHVSNEYALKIKKTKNLQLIRNSAPFIYKRKVEILNAIGFLGRRIDEKGFPLFKSVTKRIKGQKPQIKILAMGDAPNLADEYLESDGHIKFLSPSFEVSDFYNSIDILFFPSTAPESLPLVILEAIAFDVGVIAYPLKGVVEILGDNYPLYIHKENGVISEINHFYSDKFDRQKLSDIHKKKSNIFNFDEMIGKINSLYISLLFKH